MPLMVGGAADADSPWGRFGQAVRARREAIGLSQDDLALLAGFSRGTVKTVEAGRPITARTLPGLHYALGWQPRLPSEIEADTDPRPVVPDDVMRAVARAVLPVVRGEVPATDPAEVDRLRADIASMVAARSQRPPQSANTPHLQARLRSGLSASIADAVAAEVEMLPSPSDRVAAVARPDVLRAKATFPRTTVVVQGGVAAEPDAAVSGAPKVTRRPEEQVIRASGLPDELQAHLLAYAARRRESLEAELLTDLADFIELVRRTLPPQ